MIDLNSNQSKKLKEKMEAKGWSKIKQMWFFSKITTASTEAVNHLCNTCKKVALKAAMENKTNAVYCKDCMKMYKAKMQEVLDSLDS